MDDPTHQLAIAGLGLVLLALGVAAVVCGIGVIRRRERRLLEEFQRRVERSLADCRVSEERLAEAQRIGNMGSWEWNIASNDLIWSEQVYRIFGFDRQFAPTYDAYLERIHVDDREYLGQAINKAMFENTPYQIEHRIVRPDGEIRVLAAHGEVELSDAGLPVKMIGVCQDVTERAMLREESETQRLLLRNVLDGMYVFVGLMKADGVLIDVNRASAEAVGLLPSDLIGLALWDSHFWNYSTSSQNVARAAIARAAAGEIVRRDYVVRLRDNEFITVDVVFSPLRDRDGRITQIIGSGVDVTERVKVERENQQSSFRLEQAQRIASIGSWEWDFVSDTLSWSEQCYRIVGLDPREVRASFELFLTCTHPDDRCIVEEAARAAMEHGAPCDFDQRIVLPSGEVRIVHQLGEVETDAAGKAIRLNGTTQDVTELRTACAELVDAKLRAEEANHSKSNFLANMSHELRTPLNAIIGFSEILMSDTPLSADKRAEYASDIHSSGRHLLSVINDILDISRIEAGKVTLDDDVVEISEIFQACVRMAQSRADENGVEICRHIGSGMPRVIADRRLVLQVVLNLVSNAVKFTPRGGRVDLGARLAGDGGFEILVRDTGIGMSAADVKRVGEPFLQVDGRHARKFEGTGLGLVIAKRLTELHRGQLLVESAPGVGTTITVRLPASRVSHRQRHVALAAGT